MVKQLYAGRRRDGARWGSGTRSLSATSLNALYGHPLGRHHLTVNGARACGRPSFQVQAYPFRLTPANLARHRNSPNLAFGKMLKIGNDHFETTQRERKVDVCNRRYVFDAQPPANSLHPLVFNPTEKCPPFVVNPETARRAREKAHADERAYAQLVEDNVPAAPIYSGLDGGMNTAFLARFPYRVTLAKVMPYASYLPQLPPIP